MKLNLTGIDAHYLLFALDAYCKTDLRGKVQRAPNGAALSVWQRMRDHLFAAHEHPASERE